MRLTLSTTDAAVLLRCLAYGENAISQTELKNGTAKVVSNSIAKIRTQLAKNLASQVIASAAHLETNPIEQSTTLIE